MVYIYDVKDEGLTRETLQSQIPFNVEGCSGHGFDTGMDGWHGIVLQFRPR